MMHAGQSRAPVGARLVERMSIDEEERARRVDMVLPRLAAAASDADRAGVFHRSHVAALREAGLLGLIVPTAFGGAGGTLRDLAAATYALGTACPSTALCYFFHSSSASRGLLLLEAIEAGLFSADEEKVARPFAERVLRRMGDDGLWLANFASESVKSEKSAVTIATTARRTSGGFLLSGEKSFGCSTGVADLYLVTAMLEGHQTADGLAVFFVRRDADGVSERSRWDALGMRATATHGIVLRDVFVPDDEALTIPGAFTRMMRMSRGSFVGNQLAGTAVYVGAAQAVHDHALSLLCRARFEDTGQPLATSPFHLELIGKMAFHLEAAHLWLRRQLELETAEPPLLPKADVVRQWRLAKGAISESCFEVATLALKACGTSQTHNGGVIARGLRDLAMGLVQAFPPERGRIEAARSLVEGREQAALGAAEASGRGGRG